VVEFQGVACLATFGAASSALGDHLFSSSRWDASPMLAEGQSQVFAKSSVGFAAIRPPAKVQFLGDELHQMSVLADGLDADFGAAFDVQLYTHLLIRTFSVLDAHREATLRALELLLDLFGVLERCMEVICFEDDKLLGVAFVEATLLAGVLFSEGLEPIVQGSS
jgi:hypothetical protein